MTVAPARSLLANLAVLMVTVLVLLVAVEVGLRVSGYSFKLYPETIEFGAPDPVMMETGFVEDRDLFWVTPDYAEKLARYRTERPKLLFLGDSVTDLGAYDQALATRLSVPGDTALGDTVRDQGTLSFGNLGVAGWSTHQGRAQLERDVVALAPGVVTLYFGWNDHWIGFGVTDAQVAALKQGALGQTGQGLRVMQLLTQARLALSGRAVAYPKRVPLEAFRDNLRSMVATAQDHGITPMLITAASNHTEGEEPAYLGERWLNDVTELVPLHRAYVDAVRAAAAAADVPLCDAAASFEALPPDERTALMMADGIHFTDLGDRWLATVLAGCLQEAGLLARVLR
jgi:lysophospholipase L1-like esterase